MEKLIKKTLSDVKVPLDYRTQLLEELVNLGSFIMVGKDDKMWKRPGFWALVAMIIIIAVIIYGFWLPGHISL